MQAKTAATWIVFAFAALGTKPVIAASDEKVRRWIAASLDPAPAVSDAAANASLMKTRTPSESFAAWKKLKECRDDGRSLDLDLASAEHYAFIRSFAAEKGDMDVEGLPAMYGDLKGALGPAAQLLKTSSQPVSPVDSQVVMWGDRGVAAGLKDYKQATSKEPAPKSGHLNQYRLALEGYYKNYTSSVDRPKCKVSP